MAIPTDRVIISAYTDAGANRAVVTLYNYGPPNTLSTDLVLDVVMRNASGAIVTSTTAPDFTLQVWAGTTIRVIDPQFYDLFDVTSAPHYSGEAEMSTGDGTPDVIAIILKKGGVVLDVLGDPAGTTPLLSGPGVVVRNTNFSAPQNGYLASDWNITPFTYQFVDSFTGGVAPSLVIGGFADQSVDENVVNDHAEALGSGIILTTGEGFHSFSGGKLTVSFSAGHGASDSLSILNSGGIQVSNGSVLYYGEAIGHISAGQDGIAGSPLVINLLATANPSAVQALLRAIAYANESDTPGSTRMVKISLSDGRGNHAVDVTATVTINAQNDAPTIGGSKTADILEGDSVVITTAMLTAADPDDSGIGLVYKVKLTLNGHIFLGDDPTPVTQFTQADLDAGRVKFKHDGTSTTSAGFTIDLSDGGEDGAGTDTASFGLTVWRLNHAPVGNDRALPLNEDGQHVFSLGDFAFMDPNDSDRPNQLKAIVIVDLPTVGTLTFEGEDVQAGQTILASQLDQLVYTPPAGSSGTGLASFHIRVQDDGGTALGGLDTSLLAYEIRLDVSSVNDAPTSVNGTVRIMEDGSHTFSLDDFAFADLGDASAPNGLLEIVIGDLPLDGTLEFDGINVVSGQRIPAGEIGKLVYLPPVDGNGDGIATFTFAVRDNGGIANGGIDTSVEHTMTIDVTPVNDAPLSEGRPVTIQEDLSHEFSVEDFGFSDPYDGPDALLSIELTEVPAVGTFTFLGNPVSAGDIIPADQIHLLVFTPAANASGSAYATIKFRLRDDGGTADGGADTSEEASIRIDVTPRNDAPTVTGVSPTASVTDKATVRPFSAVALSDIDSATLTATVSMDRTDLGVISRSTGFRANSDGTYSITGTASAVQFALRNLTFDPVDNKLAPGLVGTTKFTVKVSDGTDATTAELDVEITSVNDTPVVANDGPINVDEGSGYTAGTFNGVLANDTDADRDILTVSGVSFSGQSGAVGTAITGVYGTLVLEADGSYTFVADQAAATALVAGQSGSDVFTYTVADGNGGTTTGTLTFKVNGTTLLIEGLELAKRTVTNSDGSLTQTIDVPLVADGGSDGIIDVPVAKSATGQTLLTATIPVGVGMRISGSPSAKDIAGGVGDLLKAIEDRTQPGSADQQALTGGAQGFLSGLPTNGSVLVQTVDITSAPSNGQPISISGAPTAAGSPKTAVVIDAGSLPSGTVLKIDNVDFAMVIGAVRVTGGAGSQTAWGDGSGQWMVLGADDDVLHGGGGDDYVGSLGGNDQLFGDEGNDTVSGGEGNDTLDGGSGIDLLIGGTGNDTYVIDMADDIVRESRGQGTDTVISSVNYVLGSNVENLTLRGEAAYGYGNSLANVLRASEKGSLLYGWGGNDTLIGSEVRDRLYGSGGNDKLSGRGGNDHLNGGSGSDRLDGGSGNDYLVGEGGSDTILGGAGRDTLSGGEGNDVVNGGSGADVLYGSSGRDAFVFNARLGKGEVDTIRNFSVANDTIRIEDAVFRKVGGKGVLAADAFHVGSKAADAEDRIVYDARKGALYYDADGSGSGKAVQFAKVGTHLKLTHEDFLII